LQPKIAALSKFAERTGFPADQRQRFLSAQNAVKLKPQIFPSWKSNDVKSPSKPCLSGANGLARPTKPVVVKSYSQLDLGAGKGFNSFRYRQIHVRTT